MAAAREEREVQIMHMKSPSSFWVTDSTILKEAEQEQAEVIKQERALTRMYNRSKQYIKPRPILPNEGELVAVRHPNTGEWHRGKVDFVCEASTGFEYQVFLVDRGYPLKKIKSPAIRELPPEFTDIGFAAYEVILDDIVPLTVKMDFLYQKMVSCVAESWPVAAWNFIENLIEQGKPAVLKINCEKDNVVFGDLFLDDTISLSDLLCKEKYATRSREDFEKVFSKIQCDLPNHLYNLGDKEKTMLEMRSKQKFLVDYVQDMESRQHLPTVQEFKEKVGYLLDDDDCSQPSLGRGNTRQKKESVVGVIANSNKRERRRVSEVGKGVHAQRNSSENERETCDSEDGLRKRSVECRSSLSVSETANRSNTRFSPTGETSPRNAHVSFGVESETSATESIDKDDYTSTSSNSTLSFYLQALSKTKQISSPLQNEAGTSMTERNEGIACDKTIPKSLNTSDRCDETKKRQRATDTYNQTSKGNGNGRVSDNQSSESRSNTTSSCDEMQEGSTNYNRSNKWTFKDNSNYIESVNGDESNETSRNTSAECTNVKISPQETKKANKDAATNYSPTCLLYLQALSKAKPVNVKPTSNVLQSEPVQKTVPENTEMETNKKAQQESFGNNEEKDDTSYGCDGTKKVQINHFVSKDNWNETESVNDRLLHETANINKKSPTTEETLPKALAESSSATANASQTEKTNVSAHISSRKSSTCSVYLEAISKAKHVKQPTHSTPSKSPQKIETPIMERTSNVMLSETSVISKSRSDSCDDMTNGPCESKPVSKDKSNNAESSNNRLHETVNESSSRFPTIEKTLSANTSGNNSTNEEGYASPDSSYHKSPSKANPALQNRIQKTDTLMAENRRSNLLAARAESKSVRELISDESLTASVRTLVHGEVRVKPIQSIYEANFPKEIHGALTKLGLKVPYRIQKYAWPAILRGRNTILVGPKSSGKTTACLVSLVSFMIIKEIYSEVQLGSGPYVLILCSGCKSAQEAYETCETILALAGRHDITLLVAYGGGQEVQLKTELVNGCDILISTPKCFLRLLRYSKYMTNLNRLVLLFLDEVDVLAYKYLPEVKQIIYECKQMLKDRAKLQMSVQVLAASQKWTLAVEQFAKNISKNFFVCISGYLEAAIYAKLKPKLHFETRETKASAVINILEGSQGMFKVVIVCLYIEEVEHLLQYFKHITQEVLFAHENVSHDAITAIKREWKYSTIPGCHPVLVCTDGVLPELEIYDAMWLIHYSMPLTKTAFGFRFSCLMDNYKNIFKTTKDDPDEPYCSVHIFLEDTSETKELPEVVRFIKRTGVPVDPMLEMKAAKVEKEKELSKSGVPLCYNLKAFGDCWESSTCKSRHVIQPEDKPKHIPVSGEVTIKVLSVIDASRFAARILDHKDISHTLNTYPNDYFAVRYKVSQFYGNKDNRIPHGIPKLGDLCAVELVMNKFYRARVTEIVMLDKHNLPKLVNVCLLDEGTTEEVKISQLLELPDKLKEPAPQAVEVFLCNIMPCDKDWSWSVMATCKMTEWIEILSNNQDEDRCLRGQIKLSLGNTLWLDPLECCTFLENVDVWIKSCNLSKDLVAVKLAVKNPEHMKRLYQLCEEGGISLPVISGTNKRATVHQPHRKPTPKQPQWAYLDNKDYQQVCFVCVNSDKIFVQLWKFKDSFQRLMTELQRNINVPKDFQPEAGMYCIAKFSHDKWNRAKILQVLDNKKVEVLYVDYGDTCIIDADQTAPMNEKYITKLPFQAIECSLIGVKPVDDNWSDEAIDFIYDFATGDSECLKVPSLFVKVCQTETTASLTGGKLHKVIMVDTSTSADVMLNRVLVEKRLAVFVQDEMKFFEDVPATEEAELSACEEVSTNRYKFNFQALEEEELQELYNYLESLHDNGQEVNEVKKSAVEEACDIISAKEEDEGPPPLMSRTKIPCVNWYQDECFVYLRIMLSGIQKYYLAWDVTTLEFCTEIMECTYLIKMELYSGIEPENLMHIHKGLYLQIALSKISKGYLWPRLLLSEDRYLWIKNEFEKFRQESESEEDVTAEAFCKKGLERLSKDTNLSKLKRPVTEYEVMAPPDTSSSDECESDPWEPPEDTVDLYDPFM